MGRLLNEGEAPMVEDDLEWELDLEEVETRAQAADDDRRNRERYWRYREVAEWLARAFAKLPAVRKVILFGSAGRPLVRERPRWRKYRRAGIELWHHCDDLDLAVWVDDLNCLAELQRTRNATVSRFQRETGFGIAAHQVEVFPMEPGTDRHLGRLCEYKVCPREDKRVECYVMAGCANTVNHLRRHPEFVLRPEALAPESSMVLFEREGPVVQSGRQETADGMG